MKRNLIRALSLVFALALLVCEIPSLRADVFYASAENVTEAETVEETSAEETPAEKDETVFEGEVVCETAAQTVRAMFYAGEGSGEIRMTPGKLKLDGKTSDVWFVWLGGLGGDQKKTNNYVSCVKSAFNIKSSYFKLIKKHIYETVPEGASIVFTGHSLGGMTAQQLRADRELTDDYDILATFTVGSPFIMTRKKLREGVLNRIADIADLVPNLSPALIFSRKNHKDKSLEDGGYGKDHDGAHNRCYTRDEIWSGYDALGVKGGNAVISFINENIVKFSA